jgi:hypothetical protein
LKIQQITAYSIESNKQDLSRHLRAPFIRVTIQNTVMWFSTAYDTEFTEIPVYLSLYQSLEQEFQSVHGIMHEQLELFND